MSHDFPPCPKCGERHYKVWEWPNPMIIHWVLNPGLAINELVLGQRLPRRSLECRSCPNLPLNERNYVPCPSCGGLHDVRVWSGKHGFGNWLGIVCPSCGERIPCLWNVFSRLILAITFPLWFVPVHFYRKHVTPTRPSLTPVIKPTPNPRKLALRFGLFWGGLMFIMMTMAPIIRQSGFDGPWDWHQIAIGIVTWSIAGAFFGVAMSWFSHRRSDATAKGSPPTQPELSS